MSIWLGLYPILKAQHGWNLAHLGAKMKKVKLSIYTQVQLSSLNEIFLGFVEITTCINFDAILTNKYE